MAPKSVLLSVEIYNTSMSFLDLTSEVLQVSMSDGLYVDM